MTGERRREPDGVESDIDANATVVIHPDDSMETISRKMEIIIARQPESLARLRKQLANLDELRGIMQTLETLAAESIAARQESELRCKILYGRQGAIS